MGDRVVIEREESLSMKGKILLPESAKEKPQRGVVIAVGAGKVDSQGKLHPLSVKVGDRVLFSSYGQNEYKLDGQNYLILSEEDLLAVYQE